MVELSLEKSGHLVYVRVSSSLSLRVVLGKGTGTFPLKTAGALRWLEGTISFYLFFELDILVKLRKAMSLNSLLRMSCVLIDVL